MDISKETTDALRARKADLNRQVDALRAEAKAIAAELDFRANIEAFNALPEAKRRAFAHVIGAQGVQPTSGVGTPGRK